MPSSQSSLLVTLAVTFYVLFSFASAQPTKRSPSPIEPRHGPHYQPSLSGYDVPLSVGPSSLPSPTATLKAITIGRGTQNYTCSTPTNSSSTAIPTPKAIGAVAELLDASPLLKLVPPEQGTALLDILPEYLVNFDTNLLSKYPIPVLGRHYFNGGGQPMFDLGSTGLLTAKKLAGIPAPSDACAGTNNKGFGAVDWLALIDAGGSRRLSEVYRVVTAGGKAPPTCAGQPATIEVQYAALYWFYD